MKIEYIVDGVTVATHDAHDGGLRFLPRKTELIELQDKEGEFQEYIVTELKWRFADNKLHLPMIYLKPVKK